MFWDKKNDQKGLPDLPEHKTIRDSMDKKNNIDDADEENDMKKTEIHGLPSFPDSAMHKGFSQMMIKDAISSEDTEESTIPPLHHNEGKSETHDKKYKIIEMDDSYPVKEEKWKQRPQISMDYGEKMKDEPIYVRLDKFQTARNSIETIRKKLGEIDHVLGRIREVKTKEDQELLAWEREVEDLKARISSINQDIFGKI